MIRSTVITSIGFSLLNTLNFGCKGTTDESGRPNFIFIYADNLGYGDLGYTGSQLHHTPNIDRMAKEGVSLTSMYVSAPVCTPSRASFLTGCYAQRVDMHLNVNRGLVLFPVSSKGLNPNEITIADMLKSEGYATACIGKWHLGDQPEFLPLNYGFDYFYGIPYSEDMVPRANRPYWPDIPLVQNDRVIEAPVDLKTTTRRYVEEAVRFITENKDRPFFLYFPHNLPGSRGVPVVDERFRGKSRNRSWGDSVEEIDWSVGELLNAVKEAGIEKNTLVIFTSDNGAPPAYRADICGVGSNEPFRGPGYSTYEGGMRMPLVATWPGKIPPGITSNELTTMMDWFPTFAYVAGAEIPNDLIIDGKNIWPIISGDKDARSPHEFFYYYYMDQLQAIRDHRWKLHLQLENKLTFGAPNDPSSQKLIDLSVDYKETRDVTDEYPGVTDRLLREATRITRELGDFHKKGEKTRPAGYVENPVPLLLE